MLLPLATSFTLIRSGERIRGEIRLSNDGDLKLWTKWQYRPSDEDRDWNWWSIFEESRNTPERYECYSAFTNGQLEGLLLLDLKMKNLETAHPITIDYLASNPDNRPPAGRLKHVGAGLIAAAILRSREIGAGGALWLEALPGACNFYENLGMVLQPNRSDQGYCVYVLSPAMANRLLAQILGKGIIQV